MAYTLLGYGKLVLSHMYIGVCEKNSDEMINSLSSASFSGR